MSSDRSPSDRSKAAAKRAVERAARPSEDVVWGNIDSVLDEADDIQLQPIDPETEAARQLVRQAESCPLVIETDKEQPVKFQFTIRHLLIGNTVLAISFGLMQWVAPSGLAGTLGVMVFAGAMLIAAYRPDGQAVHVVWWGILVLYVITCGFALFV